MRTKPRHLVNKMILDGKKHKSLNIQQIYIYILLLYEIDVLPTKIRRLCIPFPFILLCSLATTSFMFGLRVLFIISVLSLLLDISVSPNISLLLWPTNCLG